MARRKVDHVRLLANETRKSATNWSSMHPEAIQTRVMHVSMIRFNAQLDNVVQPLNLIDLHWEVLQIRAVFYELISAELNWFMVVFAFKALKIQIVYISWFTYITINN